jgi:PleD family two-component response regulator
MAKQIDPVQKVVIVNGHPDILGMLEVALEDGRYDMVFLETDERAYSQIRRAQPNLVILCTQVTDLDAFGLLTMLKLDPETKNIPVLTYTRDEGQNSHSDICQFCEDGDEGIFDRQTPAKMN